MVKYWLFKDLTICLTNRQHNFLNVRGTERGVKISTNRYTLPYYTIADVF
jgi:hypothetical protein